MFQTLLERYVHEFLFGEEKADMECYAYREFRYVTVIVENHKNILEHVRFGI